MAKDETGNPLLDMIDRLFKRIDGLEARVKVLEANAQAKPLPGRVDNSYRLCVDPTCHYMAEHLEH